MVLANKIEVIGLGALNMDNIYQVERIIEDGETVVKESAAFPGGSAANTIYSLAKLGVSTGFIGAVGNDTGGELLCQDFQKSGVDVSQIKVKAKAKTGSTLCLSDELGRRSIYVLPGANKLLTMNDLNLNYINKARCLHISSFVDDRQFRVLLKLVPKLESSVKFSFSPGALYASRGLKALQPILARTDLLFLNQSEMRQLTADDVTSGAEICLEHGCGVVVVTLGGGDNIEANAACYVMCAENEYMVETAPQDTLVAVDTTGAGDAFAAGFLYGFLRGKNLEECGRLGDIVARFSITKIGARTGLPTLDELARRYQQLYGKQL